MYIDLYLTNLSRIKSKYYNKTMHSGQELLDNLVTIIDQIYEVTPIGHPLIINSSHKHLEEYFDDSILRDYLKRLETEEQIISVVDTQTTKVNGVKTNDYYIQVFDGRYLDGWIQDINERNINSNRLLEKYNRSLTDTGFEQALEIYENNGQVFMTGSLVSGNKFNAFKSISTQRIKRIILALLFLSKEKNKTIKQTYSQQQLSETYKKLNLKNFEDDMSKSQHLRKDIGQQANDLFYFISIYLIDVNGLNYSFCPAFGRSQFQELADIEKSELLSQTRRQTRKARISQA